MAEIQDKDAEIKRLKDEEAKVVKELQALARLVDSLIVEKGAEIDAMAKLAVLLKADIAEKGAEIERLKAEVEEQRKTAESVRKLYGGLPERYDRLDEEYAELKALLIRAADALEEACLDRGIIGAPLIDELRKAAE